MSFFDRIIRPHFDQHYFERVQAAADQVFQQAHDRALGGANCLRSQWTHARGVERYYSVQRAMMEVAVECGATEVTARAGTFPMPLARHKRFLVATSIADSIEHLRRSRSRRLLADLNTVLEARQPDLFEGDQLLIDGPYFGIVLIAKGVADQRYPSGVYFGVPSSTLRAWHFYGEVQAIADLYKAEPEAEKPLAGPRLRSIPRSRVQPKRRPNEGRGG